MKWLRFATCLSLGLLGMVGCSKTTIDPQLAAELRAKYVLSAEPADATGVLDLREVLKDPQDVVLIGQIGGIDNPWTRGQASFVITDPSLAAIVEDDHDHKDHKDHKVGEKEAHKHDHNAPGHDPATCPFCSKGYDPTKALALVQFVDDAGKVLPVDARELFQLEKEQLVVIQGRAQQDPAGYLVVSAKGLFVRR